MPLLVRCAIRTSVDSMPSCRSTDLTSASSRRAKVRSVRTMSMMRAQASARHLREILDGAEIALLDVRTARMRAKMRKKRSLLFTTAANGVLISCATPATSWPSAAILACCTRRPWVGAQLAERARADRRQPVAIDEDARRGEELDAVDRLAQVVVDAGGEAGDAEGRVAARRRHDHRRALVGAGADEPAHQLEAVGVAQRVGRRCRARAAPLASTRWSSDAPSEKTSTS